MMQEILHRLSIRLQALGSRPRIEAVLVLLAALLALSAGLSGCGDPGSGGSGLPGSASSAVTGGTGSINAPTAGDFALSGQVEALDAQSVTIRGLAYASSQLDVMLRDGSTGSFSALSVGQSVGINAISGTSPTRWTLRILSP